MLAGSALPPTGSSTEGGEVDLAKRIRNSSGNGRMQHIHASTVTFWGLVVGFPSSNRTGCHYLWRFGFPGFYQQAKEHHLVEA